MILWNIVSEMMISQVISEILGEKMILPQISQMLLLLHKFINLKDPGDDLKLNQMCWVGIMSHRKGEMSQISLVSLLETN